MKLNNEIMKYLFILLVYSYSFVGIAQISTTTIAAPVNESNTNTPYDSMSNDLGKRLYQYIGQELYLNEFPENFRSYGYSNFLMDYKKSSYEKGNVYKSVDGFSSKYESIAGKYFKVLDVIKPEVQKSQLGSVDYFLKLEEKSSKDIVYYKYTVRKTEPIEVDWSTNLGKSIPSFPFIVTGYFEKQKALSVGQEYVFSDNTIKGAIDISTGKQIIGNTGDKWTCIDLTIDGKNFILSVVVKNKNGEKTIIPYSSINGKWSYGRTYTKLQVETYQQQFGNSIFQDILKGNVSIGMTKEMCTLSWGGPKSINETITAGAKSEQWVYEKNYLYFDNGILTAIQ
jgi:hypothetical protein